MLSIVSSLYFFPRVFGDAETKAMYKIESILKSYVNTCFRKTSVSHIFPKPQKYAIIESKKVLKKQHLKGEEKWGKSK